MSDLLYNFIKFLAWVFFPKFKVEGSENLPDEPAIIVGNHSQAHGPVAMQIYPKRRAYTWCVAEMMHIKSVPKYAFTDFWSRKAKWTHPLFKVISYIIAPLAAFLMTHADTIPVYRDKNIIKTLKESITKLDAGNDIVIFPECYDEHNNIVHEFQKGFVELAFVYGKRKKKNVPFVPMYICPELKKIIYGKPIYCDFTANTKEEAERIRTALMDEISGIAYELPRHKVIVYNNIRKKECPWNDRL